MWRMLVGALMSAAAGLAGAADVSAVPVLADTMRLTLQQADALLQARNLELQLGRATLAGAAAEGVVAAQSPNPSLSLNTLSISPSSGIGSGRPWDKQIDSTIRLDQLIERGGKRELRTSAAQLGIAASHSDLAELERQQRVALYAVYYDLRLAQERERIGLETVALCEQSLDEMGRQPDKLSSADYSRINIDRLKGLLAGASSMAAGEYISVRSQREMYEYQIGLEKKELELYPAQEAAELALIYRDRGLAQDDAERMATTIIANPEKALLTLAREELRLNPDELGSPWGAALSSSLSFTAGATVPLLPFLFGSHRWNLTIAIALTSLALFGVGAILSLFTRRSAARDGLRMLGIGAVAGLATYIIGSLFGVSLG